MGRELKRVALDFVWPASQIWEGFKNPHEAKNHSCMVCGGSGSSPEALLLQAQWYGNAPFAPEDRGSTPFLPTHPVVRAFAERNVSRSPEYYGSGEVVIHREAVRLANHFNRGWSHHLNADDVAALLEHRRLTDLTHTWTQGTGWQPNEPAYTPTPEEVNVWSISGGFGHDSINAYVVVEAECKRLGVDHSCAQCHGAGSIWESEEAKLASEAWAPTEPPAGPGYQIWETVSEGSPISPVFATPEELAQHMSTTRWGADKGSSYETWMKFISGPGWAPSMVMDTNGIRVGANAAL